MKSFMSVCLVKNGEIPIYRQLGDALLNLISEGILEPDSKLPPVRKMAERLKINSSTVVSAYKYLESKHAVYSLTGSGTYVAPTSAGIGNDNILMPPPPDIVVETGIRADFTSCLPPKSLFPLEEIKQAFNQTIEKSGLRIFEGVAPKYLDEFAETVSSRLRTEGIHAEKGSLFFTGSIDSALNIAAKAIVRKGDYVVLEKPCPYSRAGVYAENGAKTLQAPVNKDGISLEAFEALLKTYRPKAAHFSTYLQTPTGICYSLQNKKSILELCYKYSVTPIEEDIYGELETGGKKVFLKCLDYKSRVVYVKSLTKTCLPWLNINLCLLPKAYAQNAEKLRFSEINSDISVRMGILNELFGQFIFDKLREKIVENAQNLHKICTNILDSKLGEFVEYDRCVPGSGFWLRLKSGSSITLAKSCAKKGVIITPGSVYFGGSDSNFRFCPYGVDADRLSLGISVLREELTNALIK